jgi:hypothetical protein
MVTGFFLSGSGSCWLQVASTEQNAILTDASIKRIESQAVANVDFAAFFHDKIFLALLFCEFPGFGYGLRVGHRFPALFIT